jgi:hypothetical protein
MRRLTELRTTHPQERHTLHFPSPIGARGGKRKGKAIEPFIFSILDKPIVHTVAFTAADSRLLLL